jgi:hypothetical protein
MLRAVRKLGSGAARALACASRRFNGTAAAAGELGGVPDLWQSLVDPATCWDVTAPYEPDLPHYRPRKNMEVAFYGKTRGDVEAMDDDIRSMQREVRKLLIDPRRDGGTSQKFATIALALLQHLETLPEDHRFATPAFLSYNGPTSPNYPLLQTVLKRLFWTARAAYSRGERETFSGFAVHGRLGVGKTWTLLRPVAVAGGLLLPNVQTLFLDFSGDRTRQDVTKWSRQALAEVGVRTAADAPMNGVVDVMEQKGCALALFLDEVPELYSQRNEKAWSDINLFIKTSMPTFTVVSGSSSTLPMLVRAEPVQLIKDRFEVDRVFSMLNSDKLKLMRFHALTTRDHYGTYLRARPLDGMPDPDGPAFCRFVTQLHLHSGGRLRAIRAFEAETSGLAQLEPDGRPGPNSPAGLIFQALAQQAITAAEYVPADPFKMPVLTIQQIHNVLAKTHSLQSAEATVADLVDKDFLAPSEDGYTFARPVHYLLSRACSTVFISHSLADGQDHLSPALLQLLDGLDKHAVGKAVGLVFCKGVQEKANMLAQSTKWMVCQASLAPQGRAVLAKFALVLLDRNYATRVAKRQTGCALELETIKKDGAGLASPFVLLAYDPQDLSHSEALSVACGSNRVLLKQLQDENKPLFNIRSDRDMADLVAQLLWQSPSLDALAAADGAVS